MRQFCGGPLKPGLSRRDDIPADVLLSIYERENGPPTTTSKVITSTKVITITSCPPEVTRCPVGSKSTKTYTTTISHNSGWEWEWHKKKVTCYGDYCVSGYHCDECERQRVVYHEGSYKCEASSDPNWHRLVHCHGDQCNYSKCHGEQCNRKIVCWDGQCTSEACYGDECKKKLVCQDGKCEHQTCKGDDCHKMWVCKDGKCTVQPGCTGDCVAPSPVKPTPGGENSGSSGWADGSKSGYQSGSEYQNGGYENKGSSGGSYDPGNKGSSGAYDPGNKGESGHSGNKGSSGAYDPGNKGESGQSGTNGGPPAKVDTGSNPKNTAPVVGGSNKAVVTFHLLAAAVGVAFML